MALTGTTTMVLLGRIGGPGYLQDSCHVSAEFSDLNAHVPKFKSVVRWQPNCNSNLSAQYCRKIGYRLKNVSFRSKVLLTKAGAVPKYTQYFVLRLLISAGSLVCRNCGLWPCFKDSAALTSKRSAPSTLFPLRRCCLET